MRGWKIIKFFMLTLNWRVKFSSIFAAFLIFMTHNSSVDCKLIHFLFLIKGPKKSPTFQAFECALVKICKIPYVIFGSTSQFSFKFSINLECSNIIYLGQNQPIKVEIIEIFECGSQKMVKFLISVLNWPANFCSNFTSFFIFMTHKSLVKFELIHFLLWIKEPNKSPNFQTCFGKNLPSFPCHFWKYKSFFLQTLFFLQIDVQYCQK